MKRYHMQLMVMITVIIVLYHLFGWLEIDPIWIVIWFMGLITNRMDFDDKHKRTL